MRKAIRWEGPRDGEAGAVRLYWRPAMAAMRRAAAPMRLYDEMAERESDAMRGLLRAVRTFDADIGGVVTRPDLASWVSLCVTSEVLEGIRKRSGARVTPALAERAAAVRRPAGAASAGGAWDAQAAKEWVRRDKGRRRAEAASEAGEALLSSLPAFVRRTVPPWAVPALRVLLAGGTYREAASAGGVCESRVCQLLRDVREGAALVGVRRVGVPS